MTAPATFHFSPRANRAHEIRWREWGEDAFREAKETGKPVLLSLSAVWCHWCHVMDETSYSDEGVISFVNEHFIPVRVDNDQRPDVNRRYNMGGWPTTAFLTPDGEILNGATYIPPDAMRHYVAEVADVWRDKRAELEPRLREMKEHAAHDAAQRPGDLDPSIVDAIRWVDATLGREDAQAFAGSQDADELYYGLDAAGRAAHGAPFVDKRVYAGWNALAAAAYLAVANALGDEHAHERAVAVMRTLGARMWDGTSLAHVDGGDGPEVRGLLSDYAAAIGTILDEYETGQHLNALSAAAGMAAAMRARLEDPEQGGFWDAPAREAPGRLALREKPIEDGAAMADALLRLAALTGDELWREAALRALRGFVGEYRQWGQFAAAFGSATARALSQVRLVVVVGPATDRAAKALWQIALQSDDPNGARQWLAPPPRGAPLP